MATEDYASKYSPGRGQQALPTFEFSNANEYLDELNVGYTDPRRYGYEIDQFDWLTPEMLEKVSYKEISDLTHDIPESHPQIFTYRTSKRAKPIKVLMSRTETARLDSTGMRVGSAAVRAAQLEDMALQFPFWDRPAQANPRPRSLGLQAYAEQKIRPLREDTIALHRAMGLGKEKANYTSVPNFEETMKNVLYKVLYSALNTLGEVYKWTPERLHERQSAMVYKWFFNDKHFTNPSREKTQYRRHLLEFYDMQLLHKRQVFLNIAAGVAKIEEAENRKQGRIVPDAIG